MPTHSSSRKTGEEFFTLDGIPLQGRLVHFWQWMGSNLLTNNFRGVLAEYIVALALDIAAGTRDEWFAYDLVTADGVRIEVKSSAYLQAWFQKQPSRICFTIAPTRSWDIKTNQLSPDRRRDADIYVFALLNCMDPEQLNPLELSQWTFYVLPTSTIHQNIPRQKSITLSSLRRLEPAECDFASIRDAVSQCVSKGFGVPGDSRTEN